MIISGFGAITFSATMNVNNFLLSKGETIINNVPASFVATDEEASEKIKEWENKGYKVKKSLFEDK